MIRYREVMADEAKRKIPLGPTGDVVSRNVRRYRGGRTYQSLSDALAEVGRPIAPLGLRRIEEGNRRVDVDDLVALSIVFGVTPIALLIPEEASLTDCTGVPITGVTGTPGAREAWEWLRGYYPLSHPRGEDRYERLTPEIAEFRRLSYPDWAIIEDQVGLTPDMRRRDRVARDQILYDAMRDEMRQLARDEVARQRRRDSGNDQ